MSVLPFGLAPRRGVSVLWPRGSGQGHVASSMAALAFVLIVIQPTLAAHFGGRASLAIFAAATVLLLPYWRRVLIQPLCGIIMALAVIAVFSRDPPALALTVLVYPLFIWFCYDTTRAIRVFIGLFCVLGGIALIQAVTPHDVLSAHRFSDSAENPGGDFLQSYRPASIFASQIFYSQFFLLMGPVYVLMRRGPVWLVLVIGALGGIMGATASLVGVVLIALMNPVRHSYVAVFGYVLALAAIYLLDPARFSYNFSWADIAGSVGQRVEPTDRTTGEVLADVPSLASSTLMSVLILLSALGAMVVGNILPLLRCGTARLGQILLGVTCLIVIQFVHPILGAVFFSLSLALFTALLWQVLRHLRPVKTS